MPFIRVEWASPLSKKEDFFVSDNSGVNTAFIALNCIESHTRLWRFNARKAGLRHRWSSQGKGLCKATLGALRSIRTRASLLHPRNPTMAAQTANLLNFCARLQLQTDIPSS